MAHHNFLIHYILRTKSIYPFSRTQILLIIKFVVIFAIYGPYLTVDTTLFTSARNNKVCRRRRRRNNHLGHTCVRAYIAFHSHSICEQFVRRFFLSTSLEFHIFWTVHKLHSIHCIRSSKIEFHQMNYIFGTNCMVVFMLRLRMHVCQFCGICAYGGMQLEFD